MSTISTEERREVARRLRETGEELGSAALLWYHIAKALGVRTATGGKTACNMLADLIEPSEPKVKCVAEVKVDGEKLEEQVHDAAVELTGIDRDALLALADEIDDKSNDGTVNPDPTRPLASSLDLFGYAKRIREAVGA